MTNTAVPPHVIRKLRRKQRRIFRRLLLVLVLIIGLAMWLLPKYFPDGFSPSSDTATQSSGTDLEQQTSTDKSFSKDAPGFGVLTPDGKSLDELDGWTVTPPSGNGTSYFAFVDKVGNVQLQISQQELPPDLKTNTEEQLKDLSSGFNADRRVTSSDGTTIYIGTSTNGPQSVITSKNGLLILIKSSGNLDENQWSKYIDSLE